jgi:hypothetical protein
VQLIIISAIAAALLVSFIVASVASYTLRGDLDVLLLFRATGALCISPS